MKNLIFDLEMRGRLTHEFDLYSSTYVVPRVDYTLKYSKKELS